MRKIVQRFLGLFELLGLAACAALVLAAVVALRHIIDTPQPLESMLPGEARLYRWRYGHIFYKILGAKDAPPLVLLHSPSLGSSAYEMRKIIGALAQEYRVYAPDLLGFGLSDHPAIDYTGETYVALCHDFLSEVVGRPVMLVASGLSCNYAVHVAQRYPSICTRLVLISPVELFAGQQPLSPWTAVIQRQLGRFLIYPMLTTRPMLKRSMGRQRSSQQEQPLRSDVDYRYATTHQFGAEYAPLAQLAGRLAIDAAQQFAALQQPTLVIWGARTLNNTLFIPGEQHLPAQSEMTLIQDASVAVVEERPAQVVANIRAWSAIDGHQTAGAGSQENNAAASPAETAEQAAQPEAVVPGTLEMPAAQDAEAAPGDVHEQNNNQQLLVYCIKCKKKTPMLNPQQVTTKNGRAALRGMCAICGSGQFRIRQH